MAKYEKPMVIANDELAEGVFAASGCYTVTASRHQAPQTGRVNVRFQVNAHHDASHSCDVQYLTLNFTKPVQFISTDAQGAELVSPSSKDSTSNTIVLKLTYHNNKTDNIGIGDVTVFGDGDVDVSSASMTDVPN